MWHILRQIARTGIVTEPAPDGDMPTQQVQRIPMARCIAEHLAAHPLGPGEIPCLEASERRLQSIHHFRRYYS